MSRGLGDVYKRQISIRVVSCEQTYEVESAVPWVTARVATGRV